MLSFWLGGCFPWGLDLVTAELGIGFGFVNECLGISCLAIKGLDAGLNYLEGEEDFCWCALDDFRNTVESCGGPNVCAARFGDGKYETEVLHKCHYPCGEAVIKLQVATD